MRRTRKYTERSMLASLTALPTVSARARSDAVEEIPRLRARDRLWAAAARQARRCDRRLRSGETRSGSCGSSRLMRWRRGRRHTDHRGGVQSNHARVTAAAAAKLGLHCILVANGAPPDPPTGNALLERLLGAEARYVAVTRGSGSGHGSRGRRAPPRGPASLRHSDRRLDPARARRHSCTLSPKCSIRSNRQT